MMVCCDMWMCADTLVLQQRVEENFQKLEQAVTVDELKVVFFSVALSDAHTHVRTHALAFASCASPIVFRCMADFLLHSFATQMAMHTDG